MATPPSLTKSSALRSLGLADPDDDQARDLEAGRAPRCRGSTPFLPLNRSAAAARVDEIAGRGQQLAGRRAEFEPLLAEHNENTLGGRRKRDKFELQGAGHRDSLLVSSEIGTAAIPAPASSRPVQATDMARLGTACNSPLMHRPATGRGNVNHRHSDTGSRLNVLLCILNGFALARPFCWTIKLTC